jgi:hypothetical protein
MNRLIQGALALAVAIPLQAFAAGTVDWTHWSTSTTGTMTQNSQLINVSYAGDNYGLITEPGIYDHPLSFTNAEVTNTPPDFQTIKLIGGNDRVNTFTFDHAVVNPYIDLISVGQGGVGVSLQFVVNGSDLSILAQGTGHWGGGSLTQNGNIVTGYEGNGLLKLNGSYTSISFYTPNTENYYGITVGAAAAVPEPETWGMLLGGLSVLGLLARRRKQ